MKTLIAIAFFVATNAFADEAAIESVAIRSSGATWTFNVTLLHPDTGWDHYTNAWRIEDESGNILGQRDLAHPHVNEQPFTRSLSGVEIPDNLDVIYIRSRCNIDGWSEATKAIDLKEYMN